MKAYIIRAGSTDLDGLERVDRPDPEPGEKEILVRMRAASLNYRDQMVITGNYFGGKVTEDTVPLSDGAGEVVRAGPGVTRFQVGDRVCGTFFKHWLDGPPQPTRFEALGQNGTDGVLQEYAIFHEDNAVAVPANLSFEEAACLPCAGVTAWNALVTQGHIEPGQSVLTLGTGGVSIFGLQFAKAAGARVIATSSSDEKLARVRDLGADEIINYKATPEWGEEVVKRTGGRGVDHVVEIGGVGTLAQSMKAVGPCGNVALIGFLGGPEGNPAPHTLMGKWAKLQGIVVGNRAMFEAMNAAIEANDIKPVIDSVFAFDDARAAYEYELAGKHFGKVVIGI